MDQSSLVTMLVDDGKRLIERLVAEDFGVAAACWLKESYAGEWYLYIITPLVNEEMGTTPAYRRLGEVYQKIHDQLPWLQPLELKVRGPDEPVGKALVELYKRHPGSSPIRYEGWQLGDVNIDGAYIYPPAVVRGS
jgi:hypothetical protein